ncbi:MAG TPA: transposase [Blastocatellia bacterium]|jgi:putative DNA methylase|nr:transposase [Blastocatellia bacterium]
MSDAWKKRAIVSKVKGQTIGGPGWYSRGYLPHFDAEGQTQTVTFRLFDSMPQGVLDGWREEINSLPKKEYDLERRKRIDAYLDQGYGSCYLRDGRIAEIVQNALLHFDGERYFLHAWVVMPNHVHVLYTPQAGRELSQIAHSWKSYTANACNKALARKGEFWQPEAFDRYIRDERHFANAVSYIENNPIKAGLCDKPEDWRWSSAYSKMLGAQASLPAGLTR